MKDLSGLVVELNEVSFTYAGPPKVDAVRRASFAIERGVSVVLMGKSGSGKSTLLNLVGLLDLPTSGTLSFFGRNVMNASDVELTVMRREHIGFVFQAFHLLEHRTALENVAQALTYRGVKRRLRELKARDALGEVGLTHKSDSLPARLSGGERQRVAIARAVVSEPSLLICDEPTGNLDVATARSIQELIFGLTERGISLVLATHDISIGQLATSLISVQDGIATANHLECSL